MPLDNTKSSFSKWYSEILLKADLIDVRTPVKGANVILPTGYEVWENAKQILNREFLKTGHKNAYFPLFIPESFLVKESEHFEGFVPEVAWVTHVGETKLNQKLALRPTSETIMYYMYAQWINSHIDLPLKINQWANIIRMDTKETRPLLRDREFQWSEAHTCHDSEEGAVTQVNESIVIYSTLFDALGLSYLILRRPKYDTFPGANYTIAFDSILPDGRALQIGTTHNLGQSFARVFDIKFLDKNGETNLVHQTCYGVSTRILAALVSLHGDDLGIILPPTVAPIQVIIIPIFFKEQIEIVTAKSNEIYTLVESAGYKAKIDARSSYTAGWKFAEYEMKGVPIRIEIGPRDIKANQVVLVRRDTGQKTKIPQNKIIDNIEKLMSEINSNLKKKANDLLESKIIDATDFTQLKTIFNDKRGFVRANWCSKVECGKKIKERLAAEIRGYLENKEEEVTGTCIVCKKDAKKKVYIAQAY